MEGIVPELRWSAKERLIRQMRRCSDAKQKVRYLIIVNLLNGRTVAESAKAVQVGRSTVYDVARRFRERGEAGLIDGREENGDRKLDERYLATLSEVVQSSPQDHGWRRPTWTREMLVDTLRQKTGVRINVATMSIALKTIGARRGRPKPSVKCPWSKRAKDRRLRKIQQLLEQLPPDEVAVYEDEVDIHLNPKIGLDWMVRGQQKEVLTPGKNQKRYLAGALDAHSGQLLWVEGERKTSALFIALLQKLMQIYLRAPVIHVILDNYRIHDSKIVQAALRGFAGRIQLHFLPPYCPDDNKIERAWEDLHANVTRNHSCPNMTILMREVRYHLRKRNRKLTKRGQANAAATRAAA